MESREIMAVKLIHRFIERQKFIVELLDSNLKTREGASAPFKYWVNGQIGKIKGWDYFLHGLGIRIENKQTRELINFDFGPDGEKGMFIPEWIISYTHHEIKAERLDPKQYLDFVKIDTWNSIMEVLLKEGIIKMQEKKTFFHLTDKAFPYLS